ncbi:PEP-CTERM sorting domain-containing protein [Stieleria varia]|uniref:Ice-binding protein C-terminal domain-containing protein n=1 Tax=Stieleria varia TaxID=2528005 RepID=A0A5C6B8Z4_9BACT|nr:hypothetical protein Pla52n_06930 [Stieleria varia]
MIDRSAAGRLVLTLGLLLSASSASFAEVVTRPTGLNLGDQYRLAFVTSVGRDASSANIADYNTFVSNVANSVPALAALGTSWNTIASTSTVDARDNTGTNPLTSDPSVPIYLLNDTLLATGNSDLWDGSILNSLSVTETDTRHSDFVWTGTRFNGIGDADFAMPGISPNFSTLNVLQGHSSIATLDWINVSLVRSPSLSYSFYALSAPITVTSVPEPSSLAVLAMGTLCLTSRRRSQRQKRRAVSAE